MVNLFREVESADLGIYVCTLIRVEFPHKSSIKCYFGEIVE